MAKGWGRGDSAWHCSGRTPRHFAPAVGARLQPEQTRKVAEPKHPGEAAGRSSIPRRGASRPQTCGVPRKEAGSARCPSRVLRHPPGDTSAAWAAPRGTGRCGAAKVPPTPWHPKATPVCSGFAPKINASVLWICTERQCRCAPDWHRKATPARYRLAPKGNAGVLWIFPTPCTP